MSNEPTMKLVTNLDRAAIEAKLREAGGAAADAGLTDLAKMFVGIEGMPEAEARALLDGLREHCMQPRFYHRYQWRAGDLLVWDNCATQHKSTFDYALPQRRLMYRTTVEGAVPC